MKLNEFKRLIKLNTDMINIFTDYAFVLERYFEVANNRVNHYELYLEFQNLHSNLIKLKGKYKL